MEFVAGTVVAEKFRLDKELGKGGMGSVWAATHLVTKKKVAVKLMHANSPELTARFIREAQTASAVRHPNVVEIHDVLALPDGTPLMVMEMLTGESLASKLVCERRLTPIDTAYIMGPVISAVAAAHAEGIVHRDLKPENIFLADYPGATTGVPKVLDFGIAKLVAHNAGGAAESNLTRTGSILGTPYYMSPEQVFGEKDVDVRADIWSLGVILYECLVGHRPFEGENFGQLLKAVTIGRFEPIETAAPWVGPHLSSLIARMLSDRSQRLTDLGEVEHALSAIRGTPSGPMLPQSLPRISQVLPPSHAATVLPHQTGSGGYPVVQSSGGFPAAAPMSGGYPVASGGYPMAMTPSSGAHQAPHQSGGYPTAPSAVASAAAMTPSPMVRSQTMEMAPRAEPLPMASPPVGKIALVVGVVLVLGIGATLAIRSVRHTDPTVANGSPSSGSTTPIETVTPPVTSTVTATTPSLGVPIADAGVAALSHGTGTATHGGASASAAPSNGAPPPSASNANANHTGPTGGLSTAVPF